MKRLGAGSYGTVFLARHGPSGIRVALKAILKVPHANDGSTRDLDYNTGELAEREQHTPGPNTAALMDTTLEEFSALHRLRGEKGMLQMHAAFHDLRYFYFATVSPVSLSGDVWLTRVGRHSTLVEISKPS